MKTFLRHAQLQGDLRLFDVQFARYMIEVNGEEVPELLLAAALASNGLSRGDTCIALDSVKNNSLYTNPDLRVVRQKLPKLNHWRRVLLSQRVVTEPAKLQADNQAPQGVNEQPASSDKTEKNDALNEKPLVTPLILDDKNRLYLARYWMFEQSLARSIKKLIDAKKPTVDTEKLKEVLNVLFKVSEQPDWQKVAVANAAMNNFSVITGGPGTGKTYTVTALLAVLIEQGVDARKIALAAPTGKAAARLTQSIQNELAGLLAKLKLADDTFEAVTLHSLLGFRPGRVEPIHCAEFPMPYEVVIIDEASMIDLPLMARMFEAVSTDTRIVLIGDKDQLHSVESGMVLGDICGGRSVAEFSQVHCSELSQAGISNLPVTENPGGKISDRIVYLHKSHRAKDEGGIGKLAAAINTGDSEQALHLINSDEYPNLSLLPHSTGHIDKILRELVVPVFANIASAETPAAALEKMSEIGVLCALRRGNTGAIKINTMVERHLQDQRLIDLEQHYYHGRPVMISENNHPLRLYNGDHGLVLHNEEQVPLVHFAFDDLSGTPKTISPSRLPLHDTFYAMTIHKSQGSEFDTVVVVLPDTDSPILSRELLYTAVTRAKSKVVVIANADQFIGCIDKRSVRQSGLREMFWQQPNPENKKLVTQPAVKSAKPIQAQWDF